MPDGNQGSTETISRQELGPEAKELMSLALPFVRNYAGSALKLPTTSGVAGFTPLQRQGQSLVVDAAQAGTGLTGKAIGAAKKLADPRAPQAVAATQAQSGVSGLGGLGTLAGGAAQANPALKQLLSGDLLDPRSNPAFDGQVRAAFRPLDQNFSEQVLPQLTSTFLQNGQYGGSRTGIAEGIATQGLSDAKGDAVSSIINNNYNTGLQAMQDAIGQALGGSQVAAQTGSALLQSSGDQLSRLLLESLGMTPQLLNASLVPGLATSSVGQQQQQLQQAQLTEEQDRFWREQLLPMLQAQDIVGLAGSIGGGSTTTTTSGSAPGPSGLDMATGAGSLLLAGLTGNPLFLFGGF